MLSRSDFRTPVDQTGHRPKLKQMHIVLYARSSSYARCCVSVGCVSVAKSAEGAAANSSGGSWSASSIGVELVAATAAEGGGGGSTGTGTTGS